jgi:tetratricopeptide (TPR) repeat protein
MPVSPGRSGEKLESWKEIAAFFRREVRTVQLWEKREGLPVRRQHHVRLGSIYAYRRDLETWWINRSAVSGHAALSADRLVLARHACALGRHFWNQRSPTHLRKAAGYFQDAIAIDPNYAEAHAGLADTFVSLSYNHLVPAIDAAVRAYEAVETALRLDPDSLVVRNALINVLTNCMWDWPRAEQECRALMDAGQTDGRTIQLFSSLMTTRGRHEMAVHLALDGFERDPHTAPVALQVALAYFYSGQYDKALQFTQRALDLEPKFTMGYAALGRIEAQRGNWDGALSAFERASEISTEALFSRALCAYAHAGRGDARTANEILHSIESRGDEACFPAYEISAVHAILNQRQRALKSLSAARRMRDMKSIYVRQDPRFHRLRGDRHFENIVSIMHPMPSPPVSESNIVH